MAASRTEGPRGAEEPPRPEQGEPAGPRESGSSGSGAGARARRSRVRLLFELACLALVLTACLRSADESIGGGDTWVAMACGRYTLGPWAMETPGRTWQMRVLDKFGVHLTQVDPFSAYSRPYVPGDSQKVGWVNQNWLTHVLMYKMKTAFGGDPYGPQRGEFLIVVYKFVQAILTGLFAYWAARVLGASALVAAAMAAFGMLLSRSFIDLRPNISSILFAAMMLTVLAYWKRGRVWALLWMIPVMIVWSNVHGGFIYAIMIFGILSGGYLVQKALGTTWPGVFWDPPWRSLVFLWGGALAVLIIPAVFSPFGLENLTHPFVVAASDEGKQWRQVVEWLPIWNTQGFGHATTYVFFLVLLGLVLLGWVMLLGLRPRLPETRGRRQRQAQEQLPWPRVDLPLLGVMGVTLTMSILSRRFIFLGGVVLAPFAAWLIQQVIDMIRLRRGQRPGLPATYELGPVSNVWLGRGAILATIAAVAWLGVFSYDTYATYYSKGEGGNRQGLSMFRRMVGIADQPVEVIDFFRKYGVEGVVLNEWNQGGYVAFHQDPDPETGKPPCQVYMDGRAQAAYTLEHYRRWSYVKGVAKLRPEQLAQRDAVNVDPEKYSELLRREGINVALVDAGKSLGLLRTLDQADDWIPVKPGKRYFVFMDSKDPRSRGALERLMQERLRGASQEN